MAVLDSKTFETAVPGIREAILEMIGAYEAQYGYEITVQVREAAPSPNPRLRQRHREAAKKTLLRLAWVPPNVWEQYGYRFLFKERQYFWNGEELRITDGEALYLYRRLMLGEPAENQRHFLYKLRQRFGDAFLTEVPRPDAKRSPKDTAKKTLDDLLRSGEGKWKQDGYQFLFKEGKYLWNETECHFTAGEALYLYRRLVLQEPVENQRYYLRHLRRKFGNAFLVEVCDV